MKILQPVNTPSWMICEDSKDDTVHVASSLASVPRFPKTKEEVELREMVYSHIFEYSLDYIAAGMRMTSIIHNDPRNIDYGCFLRWIKKSPTRYRRYNEAQEIAAEIIVDKMDAFLDVASAQGMPIENQKLLFEKTKWLSSKYNKKKYGDNKQLEVTSTPFDQDKLKDMSMEELRMMCFEESGIDPEKVGSDNE